jgi:release factor glutamine methyltransferase
MNETELLFTEMLNCDRASLYLEGKRKLDQPVLFLISQALRRRINGEPIQYILGKTEFMGLEFKVNPDVLIPRPETEILVETVIKQVSAISCKLKAVSCEPRKFNILEIGTGSGCIAISLAKFMPQAKFFATDISRKALDIARQNARLNNVTDRIKFIHSDLFAGQRVNRLTSYDIIVSNPPYIHRQEIKRLAAEIQYEPVSALDGGRDGLDFYRRIIHQAPGFLKKEGLLILEMGFDQRKSIEKIFDLSGKFKVKEVIKDYNNIERVIVAQIKE